MNTKEKKYKCTNCNETNPEKFYDYLVSRCKECKITASKNRRSELSNEKEKNIPNKDNTKISLSDISKKIDNIMENQLQLISYFKILLESQERII